MQFPYCPGAVSEMYHAFIRNTNDSTPSLVYESNQVVLVSHWIQGDVYSSNVYITTTLLLIVQNQLYSGEKYSLQIEAQNAIGRGNITGWITIGNSFLISVQWHLQYCHGNYCSPNYYFSSITSMQTFHMNLYSLLMQKLTLMGADCA